MIAVLGPGGVGAFLGAALARAGEDVVLIGREATVAAVNRDGITVDSARLGAFIAHPVSATSLDQPADALLVATKAKDLEAALGRVREEPHLVVPLLNGLDHLATLRERLTRWEAAVRSGMTQEQFVEEVRAEVAALGAPPSFVEVLPLAQSYEGLKLYCEQVPA